MSVRKRISIAVTTALASLLVIVATALAWAAPGITPKCAPNADQYAWTITLSGEESNYNFDWSFDSHFANYKTVAGQQGGNPLVTDREGDKLYVRWSSDHASKNSAYANNELCEQPSPSPTATPTEEPTATPTEEPTATPTEEPTATPTEKPSHTTRPTLPPTDSDVIPSGTNAPGLPVVGGLSLAGMVGALLLARRQRKNAR